MEWDILKSIGIIRELDDLGRIVVQKEIRDMLDINARDLGYVYIKGKDIDGNKK